MPRTTVDIEEPILRELKVLGQEKGRPLGKLISELVAEALAHRSEQQRPMAPPRLTWISKPMRSTVDWADTQTLDVLLEEDDVETLTGQRVRRAPGRSG